jgi:16S rRNA (uracil1498-N3)-methyltransferase
LVADPGAEKPFSALAPPVLEKVEEAERTQVVLLVGPEGGLSPAEIEELDRHGALRGHLGNHILRTENAGLVAMAALRAGLGWL